MTLFLICPPKERAARGMEGFEELLQTDLKANCKSFLNCKGIVEVQRRKKMEKNYAQKTPTTETGLFVE